MLEVLKPVLVPAAATLFGVVAGKLFGKFAPSSWLKNASDKTLLGLSSLGLLNHDLTWNSIGTSRLAGAITGIVGTYLHWKRNEKKRLGIKDVHHDIQEAMNPVELASQVEQNQRIQDGLSELLSQPNARPFTSRFTPRGNVVEEALVREPTASIHR